MNEETKTTPVPLPPEAEFPDIPNNLLVQNREPLTAERQAALDAAQAALTKTLEQHKDGRAALNAIRREKSKVRIEKLKASVSGETKKMPLSGKDALKAIAAGDETLGSSAAAKREKRGLPPVKAKTPAKAKTSAKASKPKAAKKPAKASAPRKAKKGGGSVRAGSKLEVIADLLKRKDGCTTADILKATGWPSVSVPAMAKAAGLSLKKEKDGSVTRYRAS